MNLKYAAYWIRPSGEIIPVEAKHIDVIIKSPEKYGLTKNKITVLYKEKGESIGHEGKARDRIMRDLLARGWIRLRWREKEYAWTCQLIGLTPDKKLSIHNWAKAVTCGTIDESTLNCGVKIITLGQVRKINMKDVIADKDFKLPE